MKSVLNKDRRAFVWIDDDAITSDAEVWLDNTPIRGLLIRPQANRGLTPADLDIVEDFIDQVAPDASGM